MRLELQKPKNKPAIKRRKSVTRKAKGNSYIAASLFRPLYQKAMLNVPLHKLAAATGIPPRRLVAFGNGSARPTLSQYNRIRKAVR